MSIPKSRPPFDRLRANGILVCSTAVFRMIAVDLIPLSHLFDKPVLSEVEGLRARLSRQRERA